jgi:sugar phosphate permease
MQQVNQEFNHKTGFFSVIKRDFFSLPISIRIISASMFLFILGRGLGGDTFFSVYLKTIVDNVFRVSVIAAALPIIRMFLAVSVGALDDHTNIRSVVFLSKALYVFTGLFFFLAGIEHSIVFLIIAVLFNALSTATLLTSYESLIRKYSQKENRSTSFGLYFSCTNLAYVV